MCIIINTCKVIQKRRKSILHLFLYIALSPIINCKKSGGTLAERKEIPAPHIFFV